MKKTPSLTIVTLLATAIPAVAAPIIFRSFRSSPETVIPLPAATDSAAVNRFEPSRLLAARAALAEQAQDWTTILPDTAGTVRFSNPEKGALLRSFTASIRPERFTKGKLKITTTALADVLVNGESKIKKSTADSVPSPAEASIELQPEKTYKLQLNILALSDSKSDPEFKLEFIPDAGFDSVALDVSSDARRRFEIEDISLGKRVRSTSVSPNGKYMIVRYAQMFDADNTTYWSQLRETASGKILAENLDGSAFWEPSGATLCYTRNMNGRYDLYEMTLPDMKSRLLAESLPQSNFTFAPDMSYFIYHEEVKGTPESGTMRRVKTPDDRQPGNRDRAYLMKYDMKTGLSTPLTFGGYSTYLADISPDSKKILYTSSREDFSKYPFYFHSLIELDVNTLATDTIISDDGSIGRAIYSPDGRKAFVTGGPEAFGGLGRNCGNHPIANDFDTQGYLVDLALRKVTPLTRDFNPSIGNSISWCAADGKIYFTAVEGFNTNLYSLDPKNSRIARLPQEIETISNFSIGEHESDWLSYTGMTYTNIGEAFLLNLKNGKTAVIDNPMASRLADIEFGKMEPWTFKASDGTMIDGMVTLPPDFDPSKKYPLIVYYYGGTTPSNASMHHPYTPQLFASRDYVVYVINPSGTIGYGQEFSSRHVNAWGKRTAEDIIEGVKEFVKDHPYVDKDKIGCLGASYGGFMTQYLQTLTDIFAAAVSHAGISDVTSYWGEGYWGYSYNAVAAAQSYPWTNPELFTQQGSLFNADKIHTPLLLLHGSRDTNVPIGESIQLFNALRILGRDVEFITVDDQDHIITDYNKRKLWQATIMAWFAKYLQNDSRWWDSMYGK